MAGFPQIYPFGAKYARVFGRLTHDACVKDDATLATEAGTLYNNAVQQNGYCTYYPNIW